jgi:adenosylhomocysteine nucleosidase
MLLRWLVNQYLRDAAEQKVREVVADTFTQRAPRPAPEPSPSPSSSSSENSDDEFLPCDVAFVFALGIESGGLVDALQGAETSRHPHGIERAGKLDGREVVIVESGVGAAAAARATKAAIGFYKPRWVVAAGFAGALHEDLRRGHVLMADSVVGESGEPLSVGIRLEQRVIEATKGLHVGRLLTVDRLIRRPEERRHLATQHSALACDMETFAVAQVCRDLNTRLLSVRIISDTLDDELPPEIENLLAQKSLAGKIGAAAGAVMHRFSAVKDRLAKFLRGAVGQLG